MKMEEADRIAQTFVAARRRAQALATYPGPLPRTLADAYRIQDRAIALSPDQIRGWKVGRINAPLDEQLGSNRLAGPIFTVTASEDAAPAMPVFRDGFAAAEAEYLIRIGQTPTRPLELTLENVADIVDVVHVGIEIASSPYPRINADGPTVTVSDFGNNNGLIVGAAIPDWRELTFLDWPTATIINGEVIGRATARTMLDGPMGAVVFLARCLADRGLTLKPGDWVSSGAVTGVHEVTIGDRVTTTFGDLSVSCSIEAAASEERMMEGRDGDTTG